MPALQVDLPDGRTLQLDVWDTAGQERYRTLAPLYYRNAVGAVIVFDITSRTSFESCAAWVADFKEQREGAADLILVRPCCSNPLRLCVLGLCCCQRCGAVCTGAIGNRWCTGRLRHAPRTCKPMEHALWLLQQSLRGLL